MQIYPYLRYLAAIEIFCGKLSETENVPYDRIKQLKFKPAEAVLDLMMMMTKMTTISYSSSSSSISHSSSSSSISNISNIRSKILFM